MKKFLRLLILPAIIMSSCSQVDKKDLETQSEEEQTEVTVKNKELSTLYHQLKAENVDIVLSENFIGRGENGYTWDRESHRAYLSNGMYKVDSIVRQFGEGEYVSTMFVRTMEYQGDTVAAPIMQVKRFKDGAIVEIWEYWDFREE